MKEKFTVRLDLPGLKKPHQEFIDQLYKRGMMLSLDTYVEISSNPKDMKSQVQKAKKELIKMRIVEENTQKNYSTSLGRCKSYRIAKKYYNLLRIEIVDDLEEVSINLVIDNDLKRWILESYLSIGVSNEPSADMIKLMLIKNRKLWITRKNVEGRIYSSFTNLDKEYRKYITLDDESIALADVKSIQPYLLGKISGDSNLVECCTDENSDVYRMIGESYDQYDRSKAKKHVITALFDKDRTHHDRVNTAFMAYFPEAYQLMSDVKEDDHRELAKTLANEEVKYMEKIWSELARRKIKFLTLHDCIAAKEKDIEEVVQVMKWAFGDNPPRISLESCA